MLQRWEKRVSIDYAYLGLLQSLITILTCCHWFACIWGLQACVSLPTRTCGPKLVSCMMAIIPLLTPAADGAGWGGPGWDGAGRDGGVIWLGGTGWDWTRLDLKTLDLFRRQASTN